MHPHRTLPIKQNDWHKKRTQIVILPHAIGQLQFWYIYS